VIKTLNELHYEDLSNPAHPSIFTEDDTYNLFILRLPWTDKGVLSVESIRFALFEGEAYRFDDGKGEAVLLEKGLDSVYTIADRVVDRAMKSMDGYIDAVNELEESLLDRNISADFIEQWFHLKKDLNRIERLIIPAQRAVEEMLEKYEEQEKFPYVGFADIKEHMERTRRFALLNVKKMDEIYAFYSSLVNEKMNRTIYMLAIISGIFLPLNFLVSFFGINTGGLFFVDSPQGTMNVIGIIIGIALVSGLLMYRVRNKIFY
jgi:magnesium transporter